MFLSHIPSFRRPPRFLHSYRFKWRPRNLAKTRATRNRLSGGRFLLINGGGKTDKEYGTRQSGKTLLHIFTSNIPSLEKHLTGWSALIGLAWIGEPITDKQHGVTMIGWAFWNAPLRLDSATKEEGAGLSGRCLTVSTTQSWKLP